MSLSSNCLEHLWSIGGSYRKMSRGKQLFLDSKKNIPSSVNALVNEALDGLLLATVQL